VAGMAFLPEGCWLVVLAMRVRRGSAIIEGSYTYCISSFDPDCIP
jgi:hypothetical protein